MQSNKIALVNAYRVIVKSEQADQINDAGVPGMVRSNKVQNAELQHTKLS